MTKHSYLCTLQEPILLFKKAKTEQNNETLDYLPGSIFRGLVAANLFRNNTVDQAIDDIIFNGAVSFGDANIMINNNAKSFKVPLSFYSTSKKDNVFENFHKITDFNIKRKQVRDGYIFYDGTQVIYKKVDVGERLKAGRSKKDRSSANGAMYFYKFIAADQAFYFEVKSESISYLNKIKDILIAKNQNFGKSKDVEFGGKAKIEFLKEIQDTNDTLKGKFIYAESNLCFLNEFGEFTAWPTNEQISGNKNAEIDWEKSQIRFRTYAPYNLHRQAYDAERLIIEKGSVFVLKNDIEFTAEFLAKPIGCFITEGFGQILLNPKFLLNDIIKFNIEDIEENKTTPPEEVIVTEENKIFINYLIKKQNLNELNALIDAQTDEWVAEKDFFNKVSKAQWGAFYNTVRKINTSQELETALFGAEHGICVSGKKNKWTNEDVKKIKTMIDSGDSNKLTAIRIFAKKKIADLK